MCAAQIARLSLKDCERSSGGIIALLCEGGSSTQPTPTNITDASRVRTSQSKRHTFAGRMKIAIHR
jgi:hypothetical protein